MLLITLGDPLSINTELVKAFFTELTSYPSIKKEKIVLIGSAYHWQEQGGETLPRWVPNLGRYDEAATITFYDVGGPQQPTTDLSLFQRGSIAANSLYALKNFFPTTHRTAVLTAPICKEACSLAGFPFPGQTEFFEDLWQQKALMLLAGPKLKVGLTTNHLPLTKVSSAITPTLVCEKLGLLVNALRDLYHFSRPRIAVCGLNPHCGDGGHCGEEDKTIIAKALASVVFEAHISGPISADTVFYRAYHGGFDGVLAMYHDQGLGPLKTVHFEEAINISAGLPHLRVSPDHGPASDLFLKGQASHLSFRTAVSLIEGYFQKRNDM